MRVFALNIDYPTSIARLHVWLDGAPRTRLCRQREKRPSDGGWYLFDYYHQAKTRAQQDRRTLDFADCHYCRPQDHILHAQ